MTVSQPRAVTLFIHSFIPAISIAPLQVLYYSEALPTTARILHQSFTPKRPGNCSVGKGLAQAPYVVASGSRTHDPSVESNRLNQSATTSHHHYHHRHRRRNHHHHPILELVTFLRNVGLHVLIKTSHMSEISL